MKIKNKKLNNKGTIAVEAVSTLALVGAVISIFLISINNVNSINITNSTPNTSYAICEILIKDPGVSSNLDYYWENNPNSTKILGLGQPKTQEEQKNQNTPNSVSNTDIDLDFYFPPYIFPLPPGSPYGGIILTPTPPVEININQDYNYYFTNMQPNYNEETNSIYLNENLPYASISQEKIDALLKIEYKNGTKMIGVDKHIKWNMTISKDDGSKIYYGPTYDNAEQISSHSRNILILSEKENPTAYINDNYVYSNAIITIYSWIY